MKQELIILQPLKETDQGSDRLVRPWRGMARSILVQPIRKKFIEQLLANSKVEVSGMAKGKWIRLTGEAVIDDTVEAREAMLEANPFLRDWYSADDGKFTVFYLKNMQAVLYSLTGDPEILDN
ncbi:NimC/NimA family protein [Clostridium perfringens]|nr:NimC/NimA family protein [Clostridium perfringens]